MESGVGKEELISRTLGAENGEKHQGKEEQQTVPRAGRDRRVVGKEEQEDKEEARVVRGRSRNFQVRLTATAAIVIYMGTQLNIA